MGYFSMGYSRVLVALPAVPYGTLPSASYPLAPHSAARLPPLRCAAVRLPWAPRGTRVWGTREY